MLNSIMQTLFGGLIGGAVALAGSTFTYWNKNRELDIRMVDVALTILSAKDESTKSTYARHYALDLLDKYGGVPIGYKAEWILDKNGVPIGDWPSSRVLGAEEFPIFKGDSAWAAYMRRYIDDARKEAQDNKAPTPTP